MESMEIDEKYPLVDILKERRVSSDILWASRPWNAAVANTYYQSFTPEKTKSITLDGYRLKKILTKIRNEKQVPVTELYNAVQNIIDEIGYNRKVPILRWLGFFVAKILKKLVLSVYVNEARFLQIKSQMGDNPLLFVPSHRSYCDFILMSYICFHYEVDIPRIAAGMDFQSMALMGNVLRDACAFFMRRSFADDELYSAVFSQYVHTLLVYGDAPIEFFIEGTRSRTQKSLMPKYGFLSMTVKPFLTGLVPDITIVPVNLSYDRVLEEVLFAYELLGIPKPKETTRGFIKALSILNEGYGNIYVQFGEPISVRQYFAEKIDRSVHGFGSAELQDISPEETKHIINLAQSIVRRQRELTTLNCFNLIATVLNDYMLRESEPMDLNSLIVEVQWLFSVFQTLAPKTLLTLKSINQDMILHHLNLHKSLIHLTTNKKIQLSRIHSAQAVTDVRKLKGHALSNSSMDVAIPILMLQNYVNPCASFLFGVCFIALIMESLSPKHLMSIDELLKEFEFLCSMFSFEFVCHSDFIQEDFTKALNQSKYFRIIDIIDENMIQKGSNNKLQMFCVNILKSYIPGYMTVIEVVLECAEAFLPEKQILKTCQQRLESKLQNGFPYHFANLSLDLLSNALQSFVGMKAISKEKRGSGLELMGRREELEKIQSKLRQGIPDPWITYPPMYNSMIFSTTDLKEAKKNRKHSDCTKGHCICCQKEYLFECPDKCASKHCPPTEGNSKNTISSQPVDDKCKCHEIYQNRGSSSPNESNSESENEGENVNTDLKNPPMCECFINHKTLSSGSEKSGSTTKDSCEKSFKTIKDFVPLKGSRKICFCPFVKQLCLKKPLENETEKASLQEQKTVASKEIQTETQLTKNSKTVQTEKVSKPLPKCTCANKYLTYNFNAHKQWSKRGCQPVYSIPNVCCTSGLFHNPALACPYFMNHFTLHKCDRHDSSDGKKYRNKKKHNKERENEEDSNGELDMSQSLPNADENNFMPKGRTKWEYVEHDSVETKDSSKNSKNFYFYNQQPKLFDPFKQTIDGKHKSYLQGNSPSIFNNFQQSTYSGSKLSFPEGDYLSQNTGLDGFKNFSQNRQRPFESTFLDNKMNGGSKLFASNLRQNYYSDQTGLGIEEMRNQRNDLLFKPFGELNEKRHYGFIRSQPKYNKVLRKRKKFLANEKRRKLANAGKASYTEYQSTSLNKLSKKPEVVDKQTEVQGTSQDYINLEKIYHAENFNSSSGLFNFDKGSQTAVKDSTFCTRHSFSDALKRT